MTQNTSVGRPLVPPLEQKTWATWKHELCTNFPNGTSWQQQGNTRANRDHWQHLSVHKALACLEGQLYKPKKRLKARRWECEAGKQTRAWYPSSSLETSKNNTMAPGCVGSFILFLTLEAGTLFAGKTVDSGSARSFSTLATVSWETSKNNTIYLKTAVFARRDDDARNVANTRSLRKWVSPSQRSRDSHCQTL